MWFSLSQQYCAASVSEKIDNWERIAMARFVLTSVSCGAATRRLREFDVGSSGVTHLLPVGANRQTAAPSE